VLLAGWIAVLIIGGNAIVAGAATIIATLGLTWKGLGSALGQLTGKAERPIRDAVLDTAIADAIDLLNTKRRDHRGRRTLAQQMTYEGDS
jgi:hypothetical protein